MAQPTYNVDEFRFQEDSGSDSSPNWVADANTDISLGVGSANQILVRFQHHNTNDKIGSSQTFNFEYSLNSGTWTPITTATNVIRANTSAIFTDGDDCSNKLTDRTSVFVTNNNGYSTTGNGTACTYLANFYSECALVFYIPDTVDVDHNDDIEIRVVEGTGDTVTYSVTANITVDKPSGVRRIFITHV